MVELHLGKDDRIVFGTRDGKIVLVSACGKTGAVEFDNSVQNQPQFAFIFQETRGRNAILVECGGSLKAGTRVRIHKLRIVGEIALIVVATLLPAEIIAFAADP